MLVTDFFKKDNFPDFKLLGGASGLNRTITSVSVIDAPDVYRWLRGGEFLIGSGYIFREDPDAFIPFMLQAAEKNVAAIGIKLDRFHHSLHERLVATADKTRIPLIHIPLNYRWTDINETVYRILDHERSARVDPAAPHTAILGDGLNGKRLLSSCAISINCKIVAVSKFFELNHAFTPDGDIEKAETFSDRVQITPLRQKTLPSRGYIVSRMEFRDNPPEWVAVYNTTQGPRISLYVFMNNGENAPSFFQERTIIRAFSLLQATLIEDENMAQSNLVKVERFFEGMCLDIYSDPDVIQANMKAFGVRMPRKSRVIVAVTPDSQSDIARQHPKAVMSYGLGEFWTGLLDCSEDKFVEDLKSQKEDGVFYALGEVVRDAGDISRSYQEANQTVRWVRDSGFPPGVYLHSELCLHGFLDSIGRLPESSDVWKRYWEPLLDKEKKSAKQQAFSALKLAESLVLCDFNAKRCAAQMFIHYNTIRNHIEKLENLLKINISDPNHRLALTLAYYTDKSMRKYNFNF